MSNNDNDNTTEVEQTLEALLTHAPRFHIAKDGTVSLRTPVEWGASGNEEYIEENYFGADECVDGMECVVGGGLE